MNKYRELQKIVNDINNPKGVVLNFGCETERGIIVAIFESQGVYSYAIQPSGTIWNGAYGSVELKRKPKEGLGKILGQPLSIQSLLRACNVKLRGITTEFTSLGDVIVCNVSIGITVDLGEPMNNQDEEVYTKLIELLTK